MTDTSAGRSFKTRTSNRNQQKNTVSSAEHSLTRNTTCFKTNPRVATGKPERHVRKASHCGSKQQYSRVHPPKSLCYCLFTPHISGVVLRAHSVRGEQRNASDVVEHRQASQLMCERQTTSHGTLSINARDFACSVCLY